MNNNDSGIYPDFRNTINHPKFVRCGECNGDGVVEVVDEDGKILIECPICEGYGKYVDDSDYTGEE